MLWMPSSNIRLDIRNRNAMKPAHFDGTISGRGMRFHSCCNQLFGNGLGGCQNPRFSPNFFRWPHDHSPEPQTSSKNKAIPGLDVRF